jgi:hypothetical protein
LGWLLGPWTIQPMKCIRILYCQHICIAFFFFRLWPVNHNKKLFRNKVQSLESLQQIVEAPAINKLQIKCIQITVDAGTCMSL